MNLYNLILPILFKNIYIKIWQIYEILSNNIIVKKKQIEKDFFIKYYKINKNVNFCSV